MIPNAPHLNLLILWISFTVKYNSFNMYYIYLDFLQVYPVVYFSAHLTCFCVNNNNNKIKQIRTCTLKYWLNLASCPMDVYF